MSITTQWYNDDKRIIVTTYDGNYVWDEVYESARIANLLVDEVDYAVASIIDMSRAGALPSNAASHGKRLRSIRNPKIQFETIVGANVLIKTLSNVANQVFKIFSKNNAPIFVSTLDEALALIDSDFIHKSPPTD